MLHRGNEFNLRPLVISLHGLTVTYTAAQIHFFFFLSLNYVLLPCILIWFILEFVV